MTFHDKGLALRAQESARERAKLMDMLHRAESICLRLIDLLDTLDGDPELEGYPTHIDGVLICIPLDTEAEPDDEPDLGWSEHIGQLRLTATEDGDETSIETHGVGFVRSGGDDSEPDGTEELPWHFELTGGCLVAA